jgi:3-hydroxybutyryl-CoA dehydrogenase
MTRDTVVIIGSGLMGSGIACRAALAGNPTIMVDTELSRAQAGMEKAKVCVDELLANELCTAEQAEKAKAKLVPTDNLFQALTSARLVIEAIYENLAAKQALFETIDAQLPAQVPILSNTSGLRITDISERVKRPERCLTAHFWYPGHLVPLVEVVMSDKSSLEMAEAVRDELNRWGKATVVVKRDLAGQLANRILQAIIREAIDIVASGLASAEDVDTAVKMGMGIRFPAWGPLEHTDAVGIDLVHSTQTTVLPGIDNRPGPNPYLTELKESGNLGYKTGKGFYDWSKKDMRALEERRNSFIINALKILASK